MNNIERFLKLDGASNFREIGGIKTEDGRFLKSGILFRSDELSKLSEEDIQKISGLNIKTICDLRTPSEIKSRPTKIEETDSLKIINIPFFHQDWDINRLKFMWFLLTNSRKLNFEKFIKDHYQNNAFNRAREIGRVMALLTDVKNYPVLIHCKAGKDRTGLLAALIQLIAGVNYENVIEEYLMTNKFLEGKMKNIETAIRKMSFYRISTERIKPLLEVRREYLEEVLSEIFNKYSSIENYLVRVCGLNNEKLSIIKSLITENYDQSSKIEIAK